MAKGTLKNTESIVEILDSDISRIDLKTENPGFDNEKKKFTISGRIKLNKETKVGTMSFTSKDKYRYTTQPILIDEYGNRDNKNRLSTRINSVTKDANGNVTGYLYDVFYTAVDRSRLSFKIFEKTIYAISENTKKLDGIQSIEVGDSIIKNTGEKRKITITGTPRQSFVFMINKLTDSKDANDVIIQTTEESILSPSVHQLFRTDGPLGKPYKSGSINLDNDGKFVFYQDFKKETSETRYAIRIYQPHLSGVFEDNNTLGSRGGESGEIGLWESGRYTKDGWELWYQRILTQVINPTLTLKTITTWSNATVDTGSGTFVTFDNSNPIIKSYTGKYNTRRIKTESKGIRKQFKIVHIVKASSGSFALRSGSDGSGGTLGAPKFSNKRGLESDWTNSFPKDDTANGLTGNGGTIIDIDGITAVISTTSSSNDTITLTYYVNIEKFGTKDVTMEMNVDNIATLS